jgi:hypothetical protein
MLCFFIADFGCFFFRRRCYSFEVNCYLKMLPSNLNPESPVAACVKTSNYLTFKNHLIYFYFSNES